MLLCLNSNMNTLSYLVYKEMVNKLCELLGLPKVFWYGAWEDKTVMVMELLGYNIEELFNLVNRNISLKSMLMLID